MPPWPVPAARDHSQGVALPNRPMHTAGSIIVYFQHNFLSFLARVLRSAGRRVLERMIKFRSGKTEIPPPTKKSRGLCSAFRFRRASCLKPGLCLLRFLDSRAEKRYPDGVSCVLSSTVADGPDLSPPIPSAISLSSFSFVRAQHSSTRRDNSRALCVPALANTDARVSVFAETPFAPRPQPPQSLDPPLRFPQPEFQWGRHHSRD